GIKRIAAVLDTGRLVPQQWPAMEQSARSLGVEPHLVEITKADDLGPAFDLAIKHRAEAIVVGLRPVLQNHVGRVADLATQDRLPAAFFGRVFVAAGGLMSCGVGYADSERSAA